MIVGVNRIWYKSTGFQEGLNVGVQFLYPDLEKSGLLSLVEAGSGLYYVDFDFTSSGNHAATFFENGEKSTFKSFNIYDIDMPGVVTKK